MTKFTIGELITFAESRRTEREIYGTRESAIYGAIVTALEQHTEMYARLTEVVECWDSDYYYKRMIDVVSDCRATIAKARGGV